MSLLSQLLFILFLVRTIRNTFYQAYLWQLKEYRWDRMLVFLKTSQGKRLIFGKLSIAKWLTIFSIGYFWLYNKVLLLIILIFFLYLLEAIVNIREFIISPKLPKLTLKIIITISAVLIMEIGSINYTDIFPLNLLFLDKFLPLLVAAFISIFALPTYVIRKIIIFIANNKIKRFRNLLVIGITGSYGKTSTKEFLATILSKKYKVAKTPEFTNTDIGIAKYILQELKPEHEIFVVEMGAYKKGEIKTICGMVKPNIGIITGINEQHLELFGSIENTMKTKFELIESLPKSATAIFNGNNPRCLEMAEWAETLGLKPIIFRTSADIKNIKLLKDHIEFNFTFENKSYLMKANLLGLQTIENILPAVYAAKSLGMSITEIQKGMAKITSPAKTMQIAGSKNGSTFIDDTFNANPDGVIAATDYMEQYKGKKVLVLTPLIELGEAADKIHAHIGEKTSKICDLILLTNINYSKSFIDGAKKNGVEEKIQIVNTSVGTKLIEDNLTGDGVVVFEGKEAGRILDKLLYA